MTREETVKIIRIMCDSYPNYKPNNISEMVDVWCMMLEDYNYNQISVALKAYVTSDTSGFAPSIGELIAKIQMISQPQELNEMEAWSLVSKALRNGTYGAVEEFSRLPPTVQEAVGNPDNLRNWATSDYKAIETVIQSNFIKTYRSVTSRAEEIKRVPAEIQKLIEKVNQNSLKAQIEQKYQNNTKLLSDKNKPPMSDTEDVEAYSEPPKEFEALKDSLRK
ncbi:MAG: replicative helicase loader/inhibitor [Ruminococcus sp.]